MYRPINIPQRSDSRSMSTGERERKRKKEGGERVLEDPMRSLCVFF